MLPNVSQIFLLKVLFLLVMERFFIKVVVIEEQEYFLVSARYIALFLKGLLSLSLSLCLSLCLSLYLSLTKNYYNLAQNNLIAITQVALLFKGIIGDYTICPTGNEVDRLEPKCGRVSEADEKPNAIGHLFAVVMLLWVWSQFYSTMGISIHYTWALGCFKGAFASVFSEFIIL